MPIGVLSVVHILSPALLHRVVEVVGQIELGELSCDSLTGAADFTTLRFATSSNEVRGEDQHILVETSCSP